MSRLESFLQHRGSLVPPAVAAVPHPVAGGCCRAAGGCCRAAGRCRRAAVPGSRRAAPPQLLPPAAAGAAPSAAAPPAAIIYIYIYIYMMGTSLKQLFKYRRFSNVIYCYCSTAQDIISQSMIKNQNRYFCYKWNYMALYLGSVSSNNM